MYQGPERRRYPRLNIGFIVSHRVKDTDDGYYLSQTKNISRGGMLLTTGKQYGASTHLEMTLRFPFSRKIKVTGEVLDSKEVARNFIYATRVQFLDMENTISQQLGDFVQAKLLDSRPAQNWGER
ncbi:MAG: PilZ domain-containing protein [Bacillota bacterium]